MLTSRPFGSLPTGEAVEIHTLANSAGASMTVITYGGIVTSLRVPDRDGRLADVVLGFDTLAAYLNGHPYFGAITGRVAGRLSSGRFTVGGAVHQLALNDGAHHLHGGIAGLDKRLWRATPAPRADNAPSLRLTYRSPDGEEAYPGNVDFSVTYTLTEDNAFVIETQAVADRPTPVNPTHHSYFNLSGESTGSIAGHELQIHADNFVPADDELIQLGRLDPVASPGNDFRQPRCLGDALPELFKRHGDLYRVRRQAGAARTLVPIARFAEPRSGRVLAVSTNEDYLQLYTGCSLDGTLVGKSGRAYGPHSGLCLECQGYPGAVNTPAMGDILVRPGEPQNRVTVYSFSTY